MSAPIFIDDVADRITIGELDEALPPGRATSFAIQLGEHFREPGVYTIRWEGPRSKAQDITFRVMPRR